jgi:hypothetical protein
MELDLDLLGSASDHFINMSFCDLKEQDDKESLSLSSHDWRFYLKDVLVGFLHIDNTCVNYNFFFYCIIAIES